MSKKLPIFMIVVMLFSLFPNNGLTRKVNAAEGFDVQLEDLDRGLIATPTDEGIFLSWRLLADEVTAYSDYGLRGTNFNVYRDGQLIDIVTKSTNYLDVEGTSTSEYYVSAIYDGVETGDESKTVTPWSETYYDLPLQTPEGGITPAGEAYTYSANDMSVGDVNGDGQYEYIVKWDPSNAKDVSQKGYTGNTYIDAYTFDGELLYRIDLGVNIRAGAHYTQFLVYDFDGNGKSELMFKTAPGTKVLHFDDEGNIASEAYITMPQEDMDAGYNHQSDLRMSADDYYEHVVSMFMEWHEYDEVKSGEWPETLEEAFGVDEQYEYPLSKDDAESLADHFIDVYAPSRSDRNELRTFEGFILEGPEYLTVFNGETGAEMDTVDYTPERFDDGLRWGDYAWDRIEPGNRVDRFLAGVAYLDGENPSAVFARGYYTRAALTAYGFNGDHITEEWSVDTGWTALSNPFNSSSGEAENEAFAALAGQGNHQLSTADVDGDGKQEIIYGAATIDDDGSLLYSTTDILPEGSANPGAEAKLGHGDALHVADIDPDRPGLEIFSVFEGGSSVPYGYALRDAETGEVIYGEYTGSDTGRGMIGDVVRGQRGYETWATQLRSADGQFLGTSNPGTNMNIKWATDMTTQIVTGSEVYDWENGTVLTTEGTSTNNGTKGNPSLVADVFGDWREELLLRTDDNSAIRIYTNSEITDRKLHTLMHDIQYRTGISWQQTGYNQPSYPSYYFGIDVDWGNISVANTGELPYVEEQGPEIDTAELGALIETAKSISNEFETYTETTYQTLQDAITEAEAAKDTIKYEYQLYSILESLQKAIDDLIEIVDLGPGFHFDFGSETSTLANGYERIAHTTEYTEEIGYGFIGGSDGFRDQEGDDLRRDFILAYQKEFAVDLANGDYDVKIISGSEWNSNTTTYILEGGESRGGKGTSGGEFVEYTDTVTVEDGQLNIEFAGEWARINAVEVVAVEDFNVKYDFGSDTSPVKYDWNQVSSTMVYDSETGYGLDQEVANRDRGVSDDVRRDFVIGGDYQFMVDLRNGTYDLKIIAGDGIASNRSSFVIEGEDVGSISSRSGEFAELEVTVTVTDGQLNVELGENGRINGLEIYAHKAIDVSELEDLIVMAKAYTNDNQTYTEASFTALQDAIATAESALATIDSEEALAEGVVALQVAINGLEESEIDVTALEELITVAKSYTNEDETYTEASFTALQDAITTAENAVDTIDTEEALAEAVAALKSAIDGLEEVDLDITTLEELISTAKAYTNEDEYYTEASFTALQDAIATAESALNTIDSEEALTEAIAALKAAIDALEERDNYDPSVVASLEDLVLNGDGVYEFNYATKTITIKKEVLDQLPEGSSIQLTNGVVKAIIPISLLLKDTDITFTFGEVSKKVIESNPEALSDLYDFSITADEEPISDFNVPITLTFVVDPAKVTNWEDLKVELIGSNGEKQEQITPISYDESSGEVVVKVSHFSIYGVFEIASQNPDEQKVDVTELEELITTAKAYSNVDQTYTSDSFAALQAAIEQAEASLDTINSEKMLEKQLTELEAAISGLKEVDSDSKDDKSDENDELPDTSSSMFTLLFIGVVMLIIGASFFFVLRSKRLKE